MNPPPPQPLLTIFLLTYNHEPYIHDTFEGILIQKTKYPFVVKILEDCSTDNTLKICQEYTAKYPDIFILINQPKNTKGQHCRWALENEIKTPYWCIIEGDDYWINPYFIEKGLAFFELNTKYNLFCGNTLYKSIDFDRICADSYRTGHNISIDNYVYLHSSARIYRNIFDFSIYNGNAFDPCNGEIYLYYLYLNRGYTYFLHEIVSVYRITNKGVYSSLSPKEQENQYIQSSFIINDYFNGKYAKHFLKFLPKNWCKSICKRIFNAKTTLKFLKKYYKYKGIIK